MSFFRSPIVSSSLHLTRTFLPRRSLQTTSIIPLLNLINNALLCALRFVGDCTELTGIFFSVSIAFRSARAMADEAVWQLQMGSKDGALNMAAFEPGYITRPGGVKEQPASMAPLFDDADYCQKPLYMWKEREREVWSDDDEEEKKDKVTQFERPQKKTMRSRSRRVQWVMEDSRDFEEEGGMRFVGDKVEQQSKYVLFEVQHADDDAALIKVS
jgi:hypothetical protein